jgi:hypothetical protein
MSADLDLYPDGPPRVTTYVAHPTDLEAIVTLLEIAAIELTPNPSATFTSDELIGKACALGGSELPIDPADAAIVLDYSSFMFEKAGDDRLRLR